MKFETSVCYDDVLLKPSFSDIESRKEVDISPFRLSNIGLSCSIPIISSPMDTITEHEMARTLSCAGGIGVIHRYNSIEEQAEEVALAIQRNPYAAGVAAAVGIGDDILRRTRAVYEAGTRIICIDVAHGHHVDRIAD